MDFAVARISSRCRVGQVRGNGDDRVLGALLRLGLLVDAEDAVPQRDLIHFSDDQVGTVAQHGAADLGADDRLLDQDLAVVLPCCRDGGVQLVGALDLGHAERRARTRRLHEDRVRQLVRRSACRRRPAPRTRACRSPRSARRRTPATCPCRSPSSGCRSRRTESRTTRAVPARLRPHPTCRARPGTPRRCAPLGTRRRSPTSSPCVSRSGEITARRPVAVFPCRVRPLAHLPDARSW